MIRAVEDTHTLIWYLFDDARLSNRAADFIDQAAAVGDQIAISTISLAEIVYLIEKGRIPAQTHDLLLAALADPDHVFMEAVFDSAVVSAMKQVPRDEIPDLPDRIVAATALHLNIPVISRDGKIRISSIQTVW